MCASQMTPDPTNEGNSAVPTVPGTGLLKAASKTTPANSNNKDDLEKNLTPPAASAYLLPLLPIPVQSIALPNVVPVESSAGPSLSQGAVNGDGSSTNQSSPVPQEASSAFATQLPTDPVIPQNVVSLGSASPVPSDQPSTETAITPSLTAAQPETNPPQVTDSAANSQDRVFSSVLSGMQPAEPVPAAPQQVEQPAVSLAPPAIASLPNGGTASQAVAAPTGDVAEPLISAFASLVCFEPQGQSVPTSKDSSIQTDGAGTADASSKTTAVQASTVQTSTVQTSAVQTSTVTLRENPDPSNVLPTNFLSPTLPQPDPKQPSAPQASPEPMPSIAHQNAPLAQTLRSELQTLIHSAMAGMAVGLRQAPAPSGDALPAAQTAPPSSGFAAVPNTTPAASVDASQQILATTGNNSFASTSFATTSAASPAPSSTAVPTIKATAATSDSQSGASSSDSPDPSVRKQTVVPAPQSVGSPAPVQPDAAIALADPALQGASVPSAAPGLAHKSDSGSTASSPDAPSMPASGDVPMHPSAGPVQMAQIVDKATQSEMRIGLNTSAFGNVEVRTVVHANEVGVLIGSEKGDLRSLLSNELPSIAHTLQQQNLRLNQVNFHQQGFAFSNQMSSGSDSQPRSFSSRRIAASALPAETSSAESGEPTAPWNSAESGLNILA